MKELSICMTHYNRKMQLLNTLQSIQNQKNATDLVEVIIVDDVSRVPLTYDDFKDFELDIKLITIQTNNKWWVNPCIGFNTAFTFISSPRVIIQNAECMHVTNIIEYVMNVLAPNNYIAMSALNLTKESSEKIMRNTHIADIDTTGANWYCHAQYRPQAFNFCAAIMADDLKMVGGFDSRFARGIWYDDDAFLHELSKCNVQICIEDSQLVYHQWHEQIWETLPNEHELKSINRHLINNL